MSFYVITSACVDLKDAACLSVCPVDCIYTLPDAPQYYINPEECIDCGSCEMVCPVKAIYQDEEVPAAEHDYIARNAEFFKQHPEVFDNHSRSWT